MAGKRKFDSDDDTNAPTSAKQLKLVPFPSYVHSDMDMDMDMSDDAASPSLYPRSTNVSNASSTSSAPSSPPLFVAPSLSRTDSLPAKPVGLMGCSVLGDAFQHHGNCTQLPKLRMACAAGGGRSRTMWSHCEQCGAIAMVDLD